MSSGISRRRPRTSLLALSIGSLIATGGSAYAQDEEEVETGAQRDDDIVVVTGSRIRRDDFTSTNATSVVTADDMRTIGAISVADMVSQLPNNVSAVAPESNPDSEFNVGATIANLRGMNTFFGTRTLTMVDSRRMVATNNGGGVDLNFIPSSLVGRIETVTGGGGATYGADAMAGVVNVILDTEIENYRLDVGYQTTAEGDGDRVNFSFATGAQLLDERGQFTIGIDYTQQDAIADCRSRAYCQRDIGILRNGVGVGTGFFGFGPPAPYSPRNDIVFEDEPQWMILEGMNHTNLTGGLMLEDGFTTDCVDYTCGAYRFTDDGTDLVPYLDGLTAAERESVDNEGDLGVTPWGDGNSPYAAVPLIPETERGNIFTRFAYDFEGGIQLAADLSYGQTQNRVLQDQTRANQQSFCIRSDNGYLQQGSQLMRDVFAARWQSGVFTPTNVNGFNDWAIECDEPPFMGGSFRDDREDGRFDFGPGTVMYKDMTGMLDRENNNKTDVTTFTLNANGDLFEGGSWTWDTYWTWGKTDTNTFIRNWRSDNRLQMALDTVVDPATNEIVCRIDSSDPSYEKWEYYPEQGDLLPHLQPGTDDIADKWRLFYEVALAEEFSPSEIQQAAADWFATIRQGCAPLNPFGNTPASAEALAFAFPSIVESTEIEQNALSLNFSGDLHRGIGAGPLLFAGGLDWREEETWNQTGDDPVTARDFQSNFNGVNAFGDDWAGVSTNTEVYAEIEMPFLANRPGANYLMTNVSKRRTRNQSDPLEVRDLVDTTSFTRYVDSWKASMVWRPVRLMTVRLTRSSDTRAPSSRELFQTNTGAQQAGGQNEILSPFRTDDPDTGQFESGEQYENISGGNSRLEPETAITETVGFVFQPIEQLAGLEVAVDYYETTVSGGIETVSAMGTVNRCAANEIGEQLPEEQWVFCRNVAFDTPDQTQAPILAVFGCNGDPDAIPPVPGCTQQEIDQILPYTNIASIASSQVNVSPYWNRGIDISISYNHQLSGGGLLYARVLTTRFLEQTVDLVGQGNLEDFKDVSGQTGSNGLTSDNGSFGINYTPTPRIRGNAFVSYSKNALTVTGQVLYTGSGRLNIQDAWLGPGESTSYYDANGVQQIVSYYPEATDTVTYGALPSWTTVNLNFSYDFGLSRFSFDRFDELTTFLNIENVGDRIPDFFSGRNAGGLNTTYFSGMGRQINVGVRMQF